MNPYRSEPDVCTLKVGDLRTRISDGALVEVVDVDAAARVVRVVPYHVMKGHKRTSSEAREHPERGIDCPASSLRDVTQADLQADPIP